MKTKANLTKLLHVAVLTAMLLASATIFTGCASKRCHATSFRKSKTSDDNVTIQCQKAQTHDGAHVYGEKTWQDVQ